MSEPSIDTVEERFVTPEADDRIQDFVGQDNEVSQNQSHDKDMKQDSNGKRAALQEPENDKDAKVRKTDHPEKASNDTPNPDTATAVAAVAAAAASVGSQQHTILPMVHPQDGSSSLPFMTEQQQQQLLQSYAQASGQDLTNLTASSLAQSMVSPMTVPGLNLFQHLQNGSVITALPGPPHIPATANISPQNEDDLSDDGQRKRGPGTRNMSNDERRQRRLLRNRIAAKECRKKKKLYIQEMEDKIKHLEQENIRLRKQVDELNAKVALGAIQGTPESYQLIKEVEELNAKLGMRQLASSSNAFTPAVVTTATGQPTSVPTPTPSPSQPQPQPQTQPSPSPSSQLTHAVDTLEQQKRSSDTTVIENSND